MHPNKHWQPCFLPAGVVGGSEQRKVENDELSHGKEEGGGSLGWVPRMETPLGQWWAGILARKAADMTCNQPKREKHAAVNAAGRRRRSEEPFDISHGEAEFWVCPDGFQSLVQHLLNMLPVFPSGMAIYSLCHCMLETCDWLFHFGFYRFYS